MKHHDIASVLVEDDGEPHTINCYNVRQSERKEPAVNNRMWKMLVAEKRARKLAVDLGTRSLEHEIMETCAAKKMCAERFPERRNGGSESEQRVCPETSPCKEEWALLRERRLPSKTVRQSGP